MRNSLSTLLPANNHGMVLDREDITSAGGFTVPGACPPLSPAPAHPARPHHAFRTAEEVAADRIPRMATMDRDTTAQTIDTAKRIELICLLFVIGGGLSAVMPLLAILGGLK